MSSFRKLIHEIHRRSLWQVLGIYALASWVIYQVVVALWEGLGLPEWVPGTTVVLLLIGLPIVLATAFVQEGAPGLGGSGDEDGGSARVPGLETTTETVAAGRRAGEEASGAAGAGADEAGSAGSPREPGASAGSLFTWSRAITGGVLAFAVLGLASAGFMGMRALGIGPAATLVSSGALERSEPIVLADFANATADSTLGVTVTEALRTDLQQSDVLRLVASTRVHDALRRMERPDTTEITPQVAREIAVRDGYSAYIEGEVREVGGRYLLNARVVSATDGEVLASFRERADGTAGIIDAIDRLGSAIRGKVGESLATIRAEPPLPQLTSASLDALGQLAQGLRVFDRGDQLAALRHFEAAADADSAFAGAWVGMAVVLGNLGIQRDRRREALERAYRHQDRLTREERHAVEAFYFADRGDLDRAIDAYLAYLAIDSTSEFASSAANNVALLYRRQRNHDRAVELFRRAIGIREATAGGGTSLNYSNLVGQLMYAGRYDEARATMEEMAEAHPDHRRTHAVRMAFAGSAADYAAVDSLAEAYLRRFGDALEGRTGGRSTLGYAAAIRGRRAEADRRFEAIEREAAGNGWDGEALQWAAVRIRTRALMDQDFDRAVADLDRALERYGYDSIPPDNVPYPTLAETYARLGAADRARKILTDYRREIPGTRREATGSLASVARALVAIHEGRLDQAEAALDEADRRNYADFVRLPVRGMLAERGGRLEDAIRLYTRYLEEPWLYRIDDDAEHRVFAILRLADLHEQTGQRSEAARYYGEFIDLWRDADPELQPRVEAARRALERLTREGA